MKVIIVDDEPTMVSLYVSILETVGITNVVCFTSVLDALDHLNTAPIPGIVISDFNMPDMNGFDFIKISRNNRNINSIKFVMVSGYELDSFMKKSLDDMNVPYFKKPFKMAEFRSYIKRLHTPHQERELVYNLQELIPCM